MEESYSNLRSHNEEIIPMHNQQSLEAIGGLRFALKFAAEFISMKMNLSDTVLIVAADPWTSF